MNEKLFHTVNASGNHLSEHHFVRAIAVKKVEIFHPRSIFNNITTVINNYFPHCLCKWKGPSSKCKFRKLWQLFKYREGSWYRTSPDMMQVPYLVHCNTSPPHQSTFIGEYSPYWFTYNLFTPTTRPPVPQSIYVGEQLLSIDLVM